MLEGVLGPGGTASGAEIKGYTLAGKTGTAEKAINGELLQGQVRRVVRRLRAGRQPEAARRGDGRRAQGRDLRRPGRRAGLAGDRQLLAQLPEDRARIRPRAAWPSTAGSPTSPSRSRTSTCSRATPRCARRWSARAPSWALERVREAGVVAASAEAQAHSRRAERNEPRLITHDRFGHRVDQVELDPTLALAARRRRRARHPRAAVGRSAPGRARRPRGARVRLDARQRGRHVPDLDDLLRRARAAGRPGDRRPSGSRG